MRREHTPKNLGYAQVLEGKLGWLLASVHAFVERNLILFAKGTNKEFREEMLKSARLSNLE